MKKLSLLLILAFTISANAQDDKTVTLTVSGQGKTQAEAKQVALRSAIEQAFGVFISSKTEILNDKLVADQITSVANGNIQSFDILNESQLPNGSWGVTLKALVSVSKLTSFVEAKGIAVEIKGGLFALNIKQQLLNEQGEIQAVSEMVGLLHEPMQISFDYVIKSSDPKSLDAESKNWEIPLVVTATTNKNIDFCANYCIKTLAALSLSSEEVTSYQSLNKAVFPVVINYNGVAKTFYLRKQSSINALNTLTSQWAYYTRLFTVQSGMDESNGNGEGRIHDFSSSRNYNNEGKSINFLTTGQQAATFSWQDKRTLSQIEQMTGYKVKPRGVVSQFKHGGFVVFEENGHGLVAAITDLGNMDWNSAKTACEELILNGYSDWHLPSKEELNALYVNLKQRGVGGFANDYYWISSEVNTNGAGYQRFGDGNQGSTSSRAIYYVRAVRAFRAIDLDPKTESSETESNKALNKYNYITDNENLFTNQQITVLDKIISDFEKTTSNEIAIVTNESIGDFTNIKEYSVSLANKMGVGKKDKNNGILFVISKKRREIFIATGVGTEQILDNSKCQEIISETIIPYFKKNEYYLGVKAGLEESIKKWTVSKNEKIIVGEKDGNIQSTQQGGKKQ